jgi:hypothetical protein
MTVAEGVDVAKRHLSSIIPELSDAPLQLEELETPPYASTWRFTFSAVLQQQNDGQTLVQLLRSRRVSKLVEIDRETGFLLAVKNAAA